MVTAAKRRGAGLGALGGFGGDLCDSLVVLCPPCFVPLTGQAPEGWRRLRRIAARGNPATCGFPGHHETLLSLFGGEFRRGEAPVGAILAQGAGLDAAGLWLLATPAVFLADRASLVLSCDKSPEFDAATALNYQAVFNAAFADRGLHFESWTGLGWPVRVEMPALPGFTPLDQALGRDVRGSLPAGETGLLWHGLLNEAQMLLHEGLSSGMDAQRCNGLWFWGGGALPALSAGGLAGVCGGGPFERAAAGLVGLAYRTTRPSAGWALVPAGDPADYGLHGPRWPARRLLLLDTEGQGRECRRLHGLRFWSREA